MKASVRKGIKLVKTGFKVSRRLSFHPLPEVDKSLRYELAYGIVLIRISGSLGKPGKLSLTFIKQLYDFLTLIITGDGELIGKLYVLPSQCKSMDYLAVHSD